MENLVQPDTFPQRPSVDPYQALQAWNDTDVDYPRNRAIHELFAAWAARTPDAVAVVCGEDVMSYGELDRRSNQLARYLRDSGVGPDVVVGLCIGRSIEMVVGVLGILKAGGAYLPLDAGYPVERLLYMLRDSQARLMLTVAATEEMLPADAVHSVRLDADWAAAIAGQPDGALSTGATADSLAYVMYTSGSTGMPKGVATVHRNVVRLVIGANYVDIGPEDAFLQLAPMAFDAATFEVWGALLNGARLVLYPGQQLDLTKLQQVIQTAGVTTVWLTAGLFNRVVDECPAAIAPVRQLLAGGDALSAPHVRRALAMGGRRTVINGYGPTECTTFSVCFPIENAAQIDAAVPIGRPISNTQAYVLDADYRPVPVGAIGELFIGGDGLARGYLGRPALTAERFVANPFGPAGSRLYRTGDLVRRNADGLLEFHGRIDRQIKVRGYRVEPGEVETALLGHPAIRQAVVTAPKDDSGDRRLVAYLVGDSGLVPEAKDLQAFLHAGLPAHLVPAAFVFLDALPLTPNGKVDRDALPPPVWRAGRRRPGSPRTPMEQAVAKCWSSALGVTEIAIDDDFYQLGGTPAMFDDLLARITGQFGIAPGTVAPPAATVAALTNWLRTHSPNTQPPKEDER